MSVVILTECKAVAELACLEAQHLLQLAMESIRAFGLTL